MGQTSQSMRTNLKIYISERVKKKLIYFFILLKIMFFIKWTTRVVVYSEKHKICHLVTGKLL